LVSAAVSPALFKGLHAEPMLSDGNELGHQESNHAIKESTGLDFHAYEVTLAYHEHVLDGCA
jgi:hypothetical protein